MKLLIINLILGLYVLPVVISYLLARYYYANINSSELKYKRLDEDKLNPDALDFMLIAFPFFNLFGLFAYITEAHKLKHRLAGNKRRTFMEAFLRLGGDKK